MQTVWHWLGKGQNARVLVSTVLLILQRLAVCWRQEQIFRLQGIRLRATRHVTLLQQSLDDLLHVVQVVCALNLGAVVLIARLVVAVGNVLDAVGGRQA